MPKKKGADILDRRETARPRWVKPRKQRTVREFTRRNHPYKRRGKVLPVTCDRYDRLEPPESIATLVFRRERPECEWVVPSVEVPLYYFDDMMLKKKLVIFHPPDTFTITGGDRVFKLVAREQVHRTFFNRYLVYEVRRELPYGGCP